MSLSPSSLPWPGLDPLDWSESRKVAHQMVEEMIDWLASARERPTWQRPSPEALAALREGVPWVGASTEEVYATFKQSILPYSTGNTGPRFWSHVIGSGTLEGALAEFLAGALNCNVFGGNQIACRLEEEVLAWLGSLVGFPAQASGLLLSGGSMANILGLSIALRTAAGPLLRSSGLLALGKSFRVYASSETHNCLVKAVELLGLGREALHSIPVDSAQQLSLPHLVNALRADRAKGLVPFCIVGNAITVGTGAIDPLAELRKLSREEGLWFHIDGAIGALACQTPELRSALLPLAEADSIALDLHKWLHVPYEAGCLLVREGQVHREAFANTTSYLSVLEGGFSSGEGWPNQLGPELSRGFKALKVWMTLKTHGLGNLVQAMSANLAQAAWLAQRLDAEPLLERLAPVRSNIVNFRYHPSDLEEGPALNQLNRRLLIELQESGHSVPSHNYLGGRFALRVALTNHRTQLEDLDSLVAEVLRLGHRFHSPFHSHASSH